MRLGLQTYRTRSGHTRIAFLAIDEDGLIAEADMIDEGREEDLVLPVLLARFQGLPLVVIASEDRISYRRHIGADHLILRRGKPYAPEYRGATRALTRMKLSELQPGPVFSVETSIENRPKRELLTSNAVGELMTNHYTQGKLLRH